MIDIHLPDISEDEALAAVIASLRQGRSQDPVTRPDYGYDLYVPNVVLARLERERVEYQQRSPGAGTFRMDPREGASAYYQAAWNLCLRGVLSPAPIHPVPAPCSNSGIVIGGGFNLTSFGRRWLADASGYEAVPTEYGRFSSLLARHADRLGDAYHVRSQEAARCYQAHVFLACCAMCGAAAESVLLSLAIAKTGDEARVNSDYRSSGGQARIERLLASQQNSHVQEELGRFTALLKYWRDDAAHGADSFIGEEEAFVALLLLLRLAGFAEDRWAALTS